MNMEQEAILNVNQFFNSSLLLQLRNLWSEQCFRDYVMQIGQESWPAHVPDGVICLLRHLDQILVPDYEPTAQHVLWSRVKSTGIVEWENLDLNCSRFRVVDGMVTLL